MLGKPCGTPCLVREPPPLLAWTMSRRTKGYLFLAFLIRFYIASQVIVRSYNHCLLEMEMRSTDDDLVDAAQTLRTVRLEQEHEPLLQARHQRYGSTRPSVASPSQTDTSSQSVSQTQLTGGHYIVDCPVAPQLVSKVSTSGVRQGMRLSRTEFTHCRYTAVTCDPNGFHSSQYNLRPLIFARPRPIEIFIAVAVYNEDDILLGRTLQTLLQNIKHLCNLKDEQWNEDGWKKVVVCIVGDGRAKFNSRAYSLLAAMGLYQEGVAVQSVDGQKTQAHVFEVQTLMMIGIFINFDGSTLLVPEFMSMK